VQTAKYEPFGERRDESAIASPAALPSLSSVGFTGHEADDEVGLINMRGRIYDPRTTRFLTPDPLLQSPLFSQSLNPYSYVNNNPINFTDPSGFQCEDADACIGQQGAGGGGGGGTSGGSTGPLYSCASWNPLDCLFHNGNANSGGGTGGGNTPQPPTKEDQTRGGADAGTGWGSSVSDANLTQSNLGGVCTACHVPRFVPRKLTTRD
jgi:RHS repeat-associated protein